MTPEFDDDRGAVEVIETVGSPARTGRIRVPRLALGLLAVGLVGVLAGRSLLFGGTGASSPEDAVNALAAAISDEDMIAALGTLVPEEVGPLADVYRDAAAKAKDLRISGADGTFAGVDLDVEGLQLAVEPIGDDLAKVRIRRGTFRWRIDPSEMGEASGVVAPEDAAPGNAALASPVAGSLSASDLSHEDRDHDRDPFLMVLRRNGGWYVSPAYTAAEVFVVRTGIPRADLSRPIVEGSAAPSPSDAVRRLAAAVNDDDVSAAIATTSSPEWASLRTYRDAIADVVGDLTIGRNQALEIDDLRLEEEPLDATHVKVRITGAEGTIRRDISNDYFLYPESTSHSIGPGQPRSAPMTRTRTWSFDGTCLVVDGSADACVGDPLGTLSLWQPIGLATVEPPYLIVVAERGGWAISPVATAAAYARAVIASVSPDDLVALAGREAEQDPSVQLEVGRSTEVHVGSKGFGVASLVVPGGSVVSVKGQARPGERYSVALYRSPTDPDPTTSVVPGASGTAEEGDLEFLAPAETTTYRVVVADHRGSATSVVLRVDDLAPRPLAFGQSTDGVLDGSAGARYFEFGGTEDQAVKPSIVVREGGRPPVDGAGIARIDIYDMSTGDPVLGRTLPSTGRYLMEVAPVPGGRSGELGAPRIEFTVRVDEARATFWESGTPSVTVLALADRDAFVNVSVPGVGTFEVRGEVLGEVLGGFALSGGCDDATFTVGGDGVVSIVADPPTTECFVDVRGTSSSPPTRVTLTVRKVG